MNIDIEELKQLIEAKLDVTNLLDLVECDMSDLVVILDELGLIYQFRYELAQAVE